ncbi:MAG: sulfotransferase domain-containing protein [Caulobacteraceae bacterium]|nr:sulfotransferase domain-containing protein [Caulobacteraceae bacterium]
MALSWPVKADAAIGAHARPPSRARTLGKTAPTHILIACMPKSGSTFLTDVVASLPGFRRADLTPAYGRRQQELDEVCLRRFAKSDYVAQNHVQHSDWTFELCRDYGVRPVVLVRDLFDVVVSLRDHLRNEGPVSPIFFAERHHAALADDKLERMIARVALPWYVGFYMSWRLAPDALLVRYEEAVAAPVQTVARILAFSGRTLPAKDIEAAVGKVRAAAASRLNVGASGRGAGLSRDVVRDVLDLIDFYPEAADDPYIKDAKARGLALLAGVDAATAPSRPASPRPSPGVAARLARWWRRKAERIAMRGLVPLALTTFGLLYWRWPQDLVPDARPHGLVDDAAVLLILSLAAGRLTAYKPRAPRPRRPAALWL